MWLSSAGKTRILLQIAKLRLHMGLGLEGLGLEVARPC